MNAAAPVKQHLIDPEICIRCHTCENTCPINAIEHDDTNVVVDASKCDFCMECIPVCPTGSIDEWRMVLEPYSLEEQYGWEELPAQEDLPGADGSPDAPDALDVDVAALLAEAHSGAGGRARPPLTASKPTINMHTVGDPAIAVVQGNYRLTDVASDSDVRHIILDFGSRPFPVLEGQSVGIVPPGAGADGKPHRPRLYSVSSPRDGERPNYNNVSLTVKREGDGIASNYLCDLEKGEEVRVAGPFGSTFLLPDDPEARLLMICTGTGSAPMRAFTMRRQRARGAVAGGMTMFFGARSPEELPYFGPLKKVPDALLQKHLVFSRVGGGAKEYVQDRMLAEADAVAELLRDEGTHVYICGRKVMEDGVERAFSRIAEEFDEKWLPLRDRMRGEGRYHVETY